MTQKPDIYLQAIDIAHQIAHAEINSHQPGGKEGQLDQLYGLASQLLNQLAADATDANIYTLLYLVKKARDGS